MDLSKRAAACFLAATIGVCTAPAAARADKRPTDKVGRDRVAGDRVAGDRVAGDEVAQHRARVTEASQKMRLGDARLRLDDLEGACEAYRESIRLLPTWWMPRLAIVRCGRFIGMPTEELLKHARFAVRARPGIPVTHAQLGFVLEEAGRDAEAVSAYSAALRGQAGMVTVRFRLGVLMARLGRLDVARRHLAAVVAARPGQMVALGLLARANEQLGHLAAAEAGLLELERRSRHPRLAAARLIRFYDRHHMRKASARARRNFRERFRL